MKIIFKKNYTSYNVNTKFYILIKLLIILISSMIICRNLYNKYNNFFDHSKYFVKNKYRLAFVFGTRPEAIKLFPLIKELKENNNFICIIINSGQHKEMIQQIFDSLKMDNYIDFNLNIMKKNQSLAKLTSTSIAKLEKIYNLINPNAVIVQGDTTTAFCAAVTAFYLKIPIFHVEAGLRTHNNFYPFPEEFNRVTIDDLSTLYFAPTKWAASNLLKENKNPKNIFVTGNTIVDSLKLTLNNTIPSEKINKLIEKAKSLCTIQNECKIILLTCHRRENYYEPIYNILNAVQKLLENFKDIVIIFPFHLNPIVRQSIKNGIPKIVYDDIINGHKIQNKNYQHLNRLLIITPLNYIDLVHLEKVSYLIMTDSGGIQEESVSIGKPLLILRENTERPEAVKSGNAYIAGISSKKIYNYASLLLTDRDLYNKISKSQNIYGKGDSRFIISEIIQNYFNNNLNKNIHFDNKKFEDILYEYDNSIIKNNNHNFIDYEENSYDIVIVLTVWKKNNIERQLIQVKNQSILKNKKTNLIIFQNSNHVYIDDIINKWKQPFTFNDKVDITFIQSPIETGYYGRFIVPLTSQIRNDSYFFICDDDMVWGNRYFENMARVVNEGYLCTSNGRIITPYFHSTNAAQNKGPNNIQACYNEDIEYDFGGHIWSGRISWLRKAWNHMPISFENSEDFWISASLKSFYNISTKIPKCPCPENNSIIPDLCSAPDKSSRIHHNAKIFNKTATHKIRHKIYIELIKKFNFPLLNKSKPEYVKNIHKKYIYGKNLFNVSDYIWKNALVWID